MKSHSEFDDQNLSKLSNFRYDEKDGIFVLSKNHLNTFNYSDGARVEKFILSTINNSRDVRYDSEELMSSVKDWPSYYHLGLGRANIFDAIELPRISKVVEIGAGCGAITRYLGENCQSVDAIEGSRIRAKIARERCRDLDNVKVFCCDVQYVDLSHNYDIVTLIGVLEYAPVYFRKINNSYSCCLSLLRKAKSALGQGGTLLIGIENKIGLKYWSGCPEDHSSVLFDSIHGYINNRSPVTFSKSELESLLKEAGFKYIRFFYCYPDYKFCSTIFSDIGTEQDYYLHNWLDIPFRCYSSRREYSFHEGLVAKTLCGAGLLREFANSFFVVASERPSSNTNEPTWIAKRFSAGRKQHLRCVTTGKCTPRRYVEKKRKNDNRKVYVIETGDMTITNTIRNSQWIEGDLVIYEIYKAFYNKEFKQKVSHLLREYFHELISRYHDGQVDKDGYPLLEGGAFDFIFRNIIRAPDGRLYDIDDEWCANHPISCDYVMYRCITWDVINSQLPWIGKKVKNREKFTRTMIKSFLPNYDRIRHNRNKRLENSFQIHVNTINKVYGIINSRKAITRNVFQSNIVQFLWEHLPNKLKSLVKELMINLM